MFKIVNNKIELPEVYDIIYEPGIFESKFFYIICLMAGLLLILLIFLVLRKKPKSQKSVLQVLSDSLINLKIADMPVQDKYVKLTKIVKEFLKYKYNIDLTSLTDKETVEFIKKNSLENIDKSLLIDIFEQAQTIKYEPNLKNYKIDEKIDKIIELIKQSKPL